MGRMQPVRGGWATKFDLLAGGPAVQAVSYQRASADKKKRGKSVADQAKHNQGKIEDHHWTWDRSFTDNALSASRYARKEREDFENLMSYIESGHGHVLVMWGMSRSQRDLAVYVRIRDLCINCGLYYWLFNGSLYDLRDPNDLSALGIQAVQAEWQAGMTRMDSMRGMTDSAERGEPHGRILYGYRRIYDELTRALVRQEPDIERREATGLDGAVEIYTRAGVVEEIFSRVAESVPLSRIERDLNDSGIPGPRSEKWRRTTIRRMVTNKAYLGIRVHYGAETPGIWPALVSQETFWACQRILTEKQRTTNIRPTRPGRAVHLLSHIARCGECDNPLAATQAKSASGIYISYACYPLRCSGITNWHLDEYVERLVVGWLSRADIYERLMAAGVGDDQRTANAMAELSRLQTDLAQWRQAAGTKGGPSPMAFANAEHNLLQQIGEAEEEIKRAMVPPVVRDVIGPDAEAKWQRLTDDGLVAVKRQIIREIMEIKVYRSGKGHKVPIEERVRIRWRYETDSPQAA